MKSRLQPAKSGFTLVELLVTLAIICVLTLVSLPAMGPMIQSNRMDGAANTIKSAFLYARNSAVAEGQTGACWLVAGFVADSGTVTPVVGVQLQVNLTGANALLIENSHRTGTGNYFEVTGSPAPVQGTDWTDSTFVAGYSGTNYTWIHSSLHYSPAKTFTGVWHFDIPQLAGAEDSTGTLTVEAWWPKSTAYCVTDATFSVYSEAGSQPFTLNQQTVGNSWYSFGTFSFKCGSSYRVELSNTSVMTGDRYVYADAIRVSGTINGPPPMDPTKQFRAAGKTWTVNCWQTAAAEKFFITVANADPSSGATVPVIAQIASNDTDLLTASSTWQDPAGNAATLTQGSRFLIQRGDPRTDTGRQWSLGSGTDLNTRWDNLPESVGVSSVDAVDNTTRVWPVTFTSTGRGGFSNANGYVTLKIYDRDRPDDTSLQRYIRVYRNTGRVSVAKNLADLE